MFTRNFWTLLALGLMLLGAIGCANTEKNRSSSPYGTGNAPASSSGASCH